MLLTEHHLEFVSLKVGGTGRFESTLSKKPHCWKSHVAAQIRNHKSSCKLRPEMTIRVMSGTFGHQVNSDTHSQTVEIHMRQLLMSRLIRIVTVCFVNLFILPITEV